MRMMVPRPVRRISLIALLFALPFLIRCVWLLQFTPVPYLVPDEFIYPFAGKLYVHGLATGNFSVFKVNAEHPPLSKLFTALFTYLLAKFSFSDISALRIEGSFFSALTCLVTYGIGTRIGKRVGLLAWALLSLDPMSIRYAGASLDATSLFFASLAVFTLLSTDGTSDRKYLPSGVFLGLATLCKYVAFPIVLGSFILVVASDSGKEAKRGLLLLGMTSLALVFAGNPLLWPPQLTGFSGYQVLLKASSVYGLSAGQVLTPLDWLEPFLRVQGRTPLAMFYVSMFAYEFTIFPRLFQSSYLPWVFMVSMVALAARKTRPIRIALETLLWFSATFLFFWLLAKTPAEPYYLVWLAPPMAIFSAIWITRWWESR